MWCREKWHCSKWHTGDYRIATNDIIGWVQNTEELHCFALPSRTSRPLGLFFYKKKGAVGPTPKAWVQSLAAEGVQMQELKTCLREYRLPQRAINGRNRVPKAAFNQTGWHFLRDIRQICVKFVCISLWGTQWHHLYGSSPWIVFPSRPTGSMFTLWTWHVVMASACAHVGVLVGRWG